MKLGIMQPYFFPYIGYWQLMGAVDEWVFFDDVQFIDKGWINRNRILHPEAHKEWQFITLPLKGRGQFDKIRDVRVDFSKSWKKQVMGKLTGYRRIACNYHETVDFVDYCLDEGEENLSVLVIATIKKISENLGINPRFHVQSHLSVEVESVSHPGQWGLHISSAMGASEYINPLGGRSIFREKEFNDRGIGINFMKCELAPYPQGNRSFCPDMSIIDVMMFNSSEEIRRMLSQYSLVRGCGDVIDE